MKQHITLDQWNQLTVEQQAAFSSTIQVGDREYLGDGLCSECGRTGLPTVGQLIEFLMKSDCYSYTFWIDASGLDHRVQGRIERVGEPLVVLGWAGDELVDALWNEVCRILKQKNQGSHQAEATNLASDLPTQTPSRKPVNLADFELGALAQYIKARDHYMETRTRELLPKWLAWAVLVRRWRLFIWLSGITAETITEPISGSLKDGYTMTSTFKVTRTPLKKRIINRLRRQGGQ